MAKPEQEQRPVGRMLAGHLLFREWAAVEIAARIASANPKKCAWDAAAVARLAVDTADAVAARLEETDESRADHPARRAEEGS